MASSSTSSVDSGSSSTTTAPKPDDKWLDAAKKKILDLSTSDDAMIKYVYDEMSKDSSPLKRDTLEQLLETRSQLATSMSNIIRILSNTASYVINNFKP